MKRCIKIFIIGLIINTSAFLLPQTTQAQAVSFQVFYDDLSPYGSWIESPQYGYVWCPRVSGFSPYSSHGYWVLTDDGWTWASDYSWGWAPFHYGRWYNDPVYGYAWVPGYEWGPGWVSWRRSDDYYGWAPIGPGVNINVAYSNGYDLPYNNWNFVRCNDFGRRNINTYYIDRSRNVTIINNTTIINTTKIDNSRKTTFSPGPDRAEVQKRSGRNIAVVPIIDQKKPAQAISKNGMQLYRPLVEINSTGGIKPAPSKLTTANEVKNQQNTRQQKEAERTSERNVKQAPIPVEAESTLKTQVNGQQNSKAPKVNTNQPFRKTIRDQQQPQSVNQVPVTSPQQAPVSQPAPRTRVRDERIPQSTISPRQPDRPVKQQPVRQQQMPQQQKIQPQQAMPQQQRVPIQRAEPAQQRMQQPQQSMPQQERPQPQQRAQPQPQERAQPQPGMQQAQPRMQPQQRPPSSAPKPRR